MHDLKALATQLRQELVRRAVDSQGDSGALLEKFQEGSEAGNHVLVSKGDGRVSVLVPIVDGDDPPDQLQITPQNNPSKILSEANRTEDFEVDGVRFAEFILNPLEIRDAGAGDRPVIGMRGTGGDGWEDPWANDGWFWGDLLLMTDLAIRGGMEIRPDVEIDKSDPRWVPLDGELRDFVESTLSRRFPGVVHRATVEKALASAQGNPTHEGAVRGLSELLEGTVKTLSPDVDVESLHGGAVAGAKHVLDAVLGEGFDDPGNVPKELVDVASAILMDADQPEHVSALAAAADGNVDVQRVIAALDSAFGDGFTLERKVTLKLVDALLSHCSKDLPLDAMITMRRLKADLAYAEEVEWFGAEHAVRPLTSNAADTKLAELYEFLRKGTHADEGRVLALATRLQGAANISSKRTNVIILTGEGGYDVDTLEARSLEVLGRDNEVLSASGADTLRGGDPVGYLTGSIQDQPGSGRGVWAADTSGKFVAHVSGAESIGSALPDEESKAQAQSSFWRFIEQVRRDGGFKGYDPNDASKKGGARIDTGGGLMVIRTRQGLAELKKSIPSELWPRLAPLVVDFQRGSNESVLGSLTDAVRRHLVEEGFADAEVELADSFRTFLLELLDGGMPAEQLQEMALEAISWRLWGVMADGNVAQRVRIDLDSLTPQERMATQSSWLHGKFNDVPGIGEYPVTIFDAGRYATDGPLVVSAEVSKKLATATDVEKLRARIALLEGSRSGLQDVNSELTDENRKLTGLAVDQEDKIDNLTFKVTWEKEKLEELDRFNKAADVTIKSLKADVADANSRIDKLNKSLKSSKTIATGLRDKVKKAVKERDETLQTLRDVEGEFGAALQAMGKDAGGGGTPEQVFNMIIGQASGVRNRAHMAMLRSAYQTAVLNMVQQLGAAIRGGNPRGAPQQAAELLNPYLQASQALGITPQPRVVTLLRAASATTNARAGSRSWQQLEAAVRNVADVRTLRSEAKASGDYVSLNPIDWFRGNGRSPLSILRRK